MCYILQFCYKLDSVTYNQSVSLHFCGTESLFDQFLLPTTKEKPRHVGITFGRLKEHFSLWKNFSKKNKYLFVIF